MSVTVRDRLGGLAASGRVAVEPPFAVVDDVLTSPLHRRRGLGSAVMGALHDPALALGARLGLLVATPEGRALYCANGRRVRAPYASAFLA